MWIISLGIIDKKLLFVVAIIINLIVELIVTYKVPEEYANDYLCYIEEDIGTIIGGIVTNFIFKQKQSKKYENKKSFKHWFYLFILIAIKDSYEIFYPAFIEESEYDYSNILNTIYGILLILITIGTSFLLNYKYYTHHIISIIIYCILNITIDLILDNFFIVDYKYIYIYIIYLINSAIIMCYLKYMMDKLYYQYMEVILLWGIIGLIVKFILYSFLSIIIHFSDSEESIINNISNYFKETNVFIIIFYQFVYYLIDNVIYHSLLILILYYLRPNHTILTDQVYIYGMALFYHDNPNKYYTLIPFVFQIFILLFYFEILEFNFCKLNKNTTKNIQEREITESEFNNDNDLDNAIELANNYIVEDNDSKSS